MLEGGKKKEKPVCYGENQGGFGPGDKSNGFKSSDCRMSDFGVKEGF